MCWDGSIATIMFTYTIIAYFSLDEHEQRNEEGKN